MSFSIRKIGMLKMPKIAMLSTHFLSFRGYPVTINPENSLTFKKYLFTKGRKPMSFPIRKIGMLKMPKIAMLSTAVYIKSTFSQKGENHVFSNPENWNAGNAENCDAVYIPSTYLSNSLNTPSSSLIYDFCWDSSYN